MKGVKTEGVLQFQGYRPLESKRWWLAIPIPAMGEQCN